MHAFLYALSNNVVDNRGFRLAAGKRGALVLVASDDAGVDGARGRR
jgi:hypothetical protein